MEPRAATVAEMPVSAGAELVRRAAGGDQVAFEHLVNARADRAFRVARAITGNDFGRAGRDPGRIRLGVASTPATA